MYGLFEVKGLKNIGVIFGNKKKNYVIFRRFGGWEYLFVDWIEWCVIDIDNIEMKIVEL